MTAIARWGWMPLTLSVALPSPAQQHLGPVYHETIGMFDQSPLRGPVMIPPPIFLAPPTLTNGVVLGGYGEPDPRGIGSSFDTSSTGYRPVGFVSPAWPVAGEPSGAGDLRLPNTPFGVVAPVAPFVPPRLPNSTRARELVVVGDRSFRGGNIHRAEGRYLLAAKADPTSPDPGIHRAQVALIRKDYGAAARHIRSAIDAAAASAPGWLANAPDIQSLYAEPADFARVLAQIESHLQANPGDRDAWFVLGVELYLSGRTRRAEDSFRRLTDRRPDEALAAFLDASRPRSRPER